MLKKFYLILLLTTVNAFGMAIDPDELRKAQLYPIYFNLFGGSNTNRTKFEEICYEPSKDRKHYFRGAYSFKSLEEAEIGVTNAKNWVTGAEAIVKAITDRNCTDKEHQASMELHLASMKLALIKSQEHLERMQNSYNQHIVTPQELAQRKLSYLSRKSNQTLSVLFSGEFSITNDYRKNKTYE